MTLFIVKTIEQKYKKIKNKEIGHIFFFSFGEKNCHILNKVFFYFIKHHNFQFEFYFGEYFFNIFPFFG
jgi:hypothetical protein